MHVRASGLRRLHDVGAGRIGLAVRRERRRRLVHLDADVAQRVDELGRRREVGLVGGDDVDARIAPRRILAAPRCRSPSRGRRGRRGRRRLRRHPAASPPAGAPPAPAAASAAPAAGAPPRAAPATSPPARRTMSSFEIVQWSREPRSIWFAPIL